MCLTGIERRSPATDSRAEWSFEVLRNQPDLAADEPQPLIGQQGAGQQPGLAEDLEAVADPEHGAAVGREATDNLHRRREAGDRTGAQVVAVGKASGNDHPVEVREVGFLMPDEATLTDPLHRIQRIALVA